jgi:hypothetical protein
MAVLQTGLAKSLAEDYTIDQSLRFDDGDSAFLKRTPGSAGNQKTFTISLWVKRGELGTNQDIFAPQLGGDGSNESKFEFTTADVLNFYDSGGTRGSYTTTQKFRDVGAWYHIVVAVDTTDSTSGDRIKIYVNGDRITDFSASAAPGDSVDLGWNGTSTQYIGVDATGGSENAGFLDGYLAEFYNIDGLQLTPSSFGETDTTTNQWKPIEYDGAYGTNGFYQKYAATELANSFTDSSGFTPSESLTVDLLVVAGGGAAGNNGGGGGAGGFQTFTDVEITAQVYQIVVGEGGAGSTDNNVQGGDGGNSSALGQTASVGGGGGGTVGSSGNHAWNNGRTGGSGGGASVSNPAHSGGSGTVGQGNAGGDNYANFADNRGGGAGGGAGAVGGDGTNNTGGDGGIGSQNDYRTGSNVYYAGGGGGCGTVTGGSGGNGGGGDGKARSAGAGDAGTANTGGGGGAAEDNVAGGAGGSGIVVIRYISTTAKATGGTITSYVDGSDTYQVHTFLSSAGHTITAVGDVTNTRAQKKVGDSSIAFDGTGDYLTIPDSPDWDFGSGDFTVECWIRTDQNTSEMAFIDDLGTNIGWRFDWQTDPLLRFAFRDTGAGWNSIEETWTPTTNTWYHLAAVRDGDDFELFVDGTSLGSTTNTDTIANSDTSLYIGAHTGATNPLDGYMDEIRLSNTARYTSNFTPQTTEFTADSNTLLLIHSNWDGGLGADSSGNYNTFTPTNLVAGDQVLDSPTNNWATCRLMNYPPSSGATFTEGNLYLTTGSSGGGRNTGRMAVSTILANSGKWYAELMVFSTTTFYCGVGTNQVSISSTADNTRYAFVYGADGKVLLNTDGSESWVTYGSAFSTGDIVQIYIDMDASTPEVFFGKNGSWGDGSGNFDETTPTSAVVLGDTFFTADTDNAGFFEFQFSSASGGTSAQGQFNFGQDSTFSSQTAAGGYSDTNEIGDFKYAVPSGAKALCVSNLPDPEIKLPGDYFNTVLWTGNTGTNAITGVGFKTDFLWGKRRDGAYYHALFDSVRGVNERLMSNVANAQDSGANYVDSFDSDGFTLGNDTNINLSGADNVGWNWLAGTAPTADNSAGAGATPTAGSVKIDGSNLGSALAGSIAATRLSANTTSGFSIISYTGTGTAGTHTIAHGLSAAPELVIVKCTDSAHAWAVGSDKGMDFTDYMTLNANTAATDDDIYWGDTAPTASVFSVSTADQTGQNNPYIAYCFHSVEGYSKVGSYTGNGNADGTFVYTGFRPAYVMYKCYNQAEDWYLLDDKRDTYNVVDKSLIANTEAAEVTTTASDTDFVSNGFKLRTTTSGNWSGYYWLYLAFAEYPFKYAPAR